MGGGQQTTVTMVAFCGAVAALLMWIVGFFLPEFAMSAPAGVESILSTIFVGLLTYFLPAWGANGNGNGNGPPPSQSGFALVKLLAVLLSLSIAIAIALVGCAGTRQAYDAADSIDEQAFVTAELYAAWRDEARELIDAGGLTPGEAQQLRAMDGRVTPAVLELAPLAQAVRAARTAANEAALQQALADASVAIAEFINAVKEARQ
jgi:hypothetical protein